MPMPSTMLYTSEFAKDPGGLLREVWKTFATDDATLGQRHDVWLPRHILPNIQPDDYRLLLVQHGQGSNGMYLDGHACM